MVLSFMISKVHFILGVIDSERMDFELLPDDAVSV